MTRGVEGEVSRLYARHISQTGFTPPNTYSDLLLFVELSGGTVAFHGDAPDEFYGLQVADWIIVGNTVRRTDRELMLILAHEWCHWLRRQSAAEPVAWLYEETDEAEERNREEHIACAFARLF